MAFVIRGKHPSVAVVVLKDSFEIYEPGEVDDWDILVSLLSMSLIFLWDFELVSRDRRLAVTGSHDEWLEYRFAPGCEKEGQRLGECIDIE